MYSSQRKEAAVTVDLSILHLAAMAIELRDRLTPEHVRKAPSLPVALDALERVFRELGWDTPAQPRLRAQETVAKRAARVRQAQLATHRMG